MPDETQAAPTATPSAAAPVPPAMPALDLTDPAVQTQLSAYSAQMQAYMRQQHEAVMREASERSRVEFERWKADEARRATIFAFAQHVTTPTLQRPSTIAYTAEQIATILANPTTETVQQIFRDAIDGVLLTSSIPTGSSREGEGAQDDAARFNALVFEKQREGLSQAEATKAVAKQHPALYNAMNKPKGGR